MNDPAKNTGGFVPGLVYVTVWRMMAQEVGMATGGSEMPLRMLD